MKLSYQKHHAPDGTVYNQRIKMTYDEADQLLSAFYTEIMLGLPRKKEYVHTSGYEIFMTQPTRDHNNLYYLNHTQTRFANLFLQLPLKNRNTYIKVA